MIRYSILLAFAVFAAAQQQVITVRTGMVRYVEGAVLLAGEPLQSPDVDAPMTRLPAIARDAVLRTRLGRAEIQMGPDSFVRLAENGAVKMLANRIDDARLELQSGSILVDIARASAGGLMQIQVGESVINFRKDGLVRVDANPAAVQVYDGDCEVVVNDLATVVMSGRRMELRESAQPQVFVSSPSDAFLRWSGRRSAYLTLAGVIPSTAERRQVISVTEDLWWTYRYHGMKVYVRVEETSRPGRSGRGPRR